MKKSSYFIILFGIIGIICVIFLPKKSKYPMAGLVHCVKKLDHFSVIVALPGSTVSVTSQLSDFQKPIYDYMKYEHDPFLPPSYGVRNDTLFVFPASKKEDRYFRQFECTGIKSVVGMDGSIIRLDYLQMDTLTIKLHHAKFYGNFDPKPNKFKMLNLVADSSRIEFANSFSFGEIKIDLNRSHLVFSVPRRNACFLLGTFENNSRLYIGNGIPKVKLVKDGTSYCNLDSLNTPTHTSTSSTQSPKF